jgi:GxxExxY protein
MKDIKALCDQVRQTAYDIHVFLGHGHLEKVYENALAHRLAKAGLDVKQQHPIKVHDEDGTLIGDYLADLRVEGELIVELKACKTLATEHEAQRSWATSRLRASSTACSSTSDPTSSRFASSPGTITQDPGPGVPCWAFSLRSLRSLRPIRKRAAHARQGDRFTVER